MLEILVPSTGSGGNIKLSLQCRDVFLQHSDQRLNKSLLCKDKNCVKEMNETYSMKCSALSCNILLRSELGFQMDQRYQSLDMLDWYYLVFCCSVHSASSSVQTGRMKIDLGRLYCELKMRKDELLLNQDVATFMQQFRNKRRILPVRVFSPGLIYLLFYS